MRRYAQQTTVTPDRSRQEIERTLARYGANQFMYGWAGKGATVGFRMHDRLVRLVVRHPSQEDVPRTPTGRAKRNQDKALDVESRRRWRSLALVVKAKLEAVDAGISTFEAEFLAHILLPDGKTVGEWASPQLDQAYRTQRMPALMPGVEA